MCVANFIVLCAAVATSASAQDWSNLSGNAARNGQSPAIGPTAPDLAWDNNDDFSIIAWAPFSEGDRVFTVREAGFPQQGGAANDAIVAYDLGTGGELWRVTLPFGGDTGEEWIAWILGVKDGRVFASRGGNGTRAPVYALDAATGATLWTSTYEIGAFAYEGVVFAPDGDPIIGWFEWLARIDAETGELDWELARSCSVSGNCGPCATDTAVFFDEAAPGGQVITKADIETGTRLYSSPVMEGFLEQKQPYLSRDGRHVYFPRVQNNIEVDFLYAWEDTGTEFAPLWNVPIRWTNVGYAISPDDTLLAVTQANELVRLDPATGAVVDSGPFPLIPDGSAQMAVDSRGTIYVSNGWASNPAGDGRLWVFDENLDHLFTLNLNRQNQGGPAIAHDGSLLLTDRSAVYAYKSACAADIDGDGDADGDDFFGYLDLFAAGDDRADLDGDGDRDADDFFTYLDLFASGC
ncbi:MAG: PQQ-like beta-propeller repeat protein [Phycisphaeraceae bacterium]|nr:PQQ-like beta-propeller repeat protein [Phycisphaeraceae bacterium]